MDQIQRNFRIGVAHEALWGMSFGLVNPFTLLALAASDLGASAGDIGWFSALCFFSINAVQLVSAFLFGPKWSRPGYVAFMHWPAILATALGALLFMPFVTMNASLRFSIFSGLFIFHWLAVGMVVPHWATMSDRCIPKEIQGRYFGWSFSISGLLGALSGGLAAHWVAAGGLNWGYALCFGLATLLQISSMLLLIKISPVFSEPEAVGALRPFLAEQWRQLREHPSLRSYLVLMALLQIAGGSIALFTAHAKAQGIETLYFERYNPALALGGMVGAAGLGYLMDWRGGRLALAAGIVPLLLGLIVLMNHASPAWGMLSFFGAGAFGAVWGTVCLPMVLRYAPIGRIPAFFGLVNTALAVTCLVPVFLGWLADKAGYQASFAFSLAGACLALIFVWRRSELAGEASVTQGAA